MQEITLKSGNVLKLSPAPFIDAIRLTNIVAKAFSQRGLDFKIDRDTEVDFWVLFNKNPDAFIKGFADIVFEEFVMNLVFKCAERCVYVKNGVSVKITQDTFESEDAREDFYEVMYNIAMCNIKPFFVNLLSVLSQTSATARSESNQS